ncbi:MAG: hypothetical protein ACI8PT_000020 [Gammaproteobacteria bacterium]|jgi:hypothetical protein
MVAVLSNSLCPHNSEFETDTRTARSDREPSRTDI